MITSESSRREIRDLQRLLLAVGLMEWSAKSTQGEWGDETQAAVLAAYEHLGWDHAPDGRWISSAALAAIASAMHQHPLRDESGDASLNTGLGTGGGGSHAGGGGSHAGGGGSHAGGGGSHAGGGGDAE